MNNVEIGFLLCTLAGLSTALGSFVVFTFKKNNYKVLAFFLGLSAGVMIYISFMELLPEAILILKIEVGTKSEVYGIAFFFIGILVSAILDRLVPAPQNPHEILPPYNSDELSCEIKRNKENYKKEKIMRTGLFTALVITLHNFPEGIATFISAMKDIQIAIPIAIAIALHNIPEGIAVAAPIYFATCSKRKAFKYTFLAGLAEPFGAFIAFLFISKIYSDFILGAIFGMIAGIMIFISFDELLPASHEYGEHHLTILGLLLGMAFMAVNLMIF